MELASLILQPSASSRAHLATHTKDSSLNGEEPVFLTVPTTPIPNKERGIENQIQNMDLKFHPNDKGTMHK